MGDRRTALISSQSRAARAESFTALPQFDVAKEFLRGPVIADSNSNQPCPGRRFGAGMGTLHCQLPPAIIGPGV